MPLGGMKSALRNKSTTGGLIPLRGAGKKTGAIHEKRKGL